MRRSVGISGIGHALPPKVVTNADLESRVDTTDEWIRTRTGIRQRRIAEPGTGTSRLGAEAAKKAIQSAGITPGDIELIVTGTTTPDLPLPSCACLIQKEIKAENAACFDLGAACSGFVYSLATAHQFIAAGTYKTALVLGADQISSFIDWKDRSTCVLFGDAAGACILQETQGSGILATDLGSDGRFQELIHVPAGGSRTPASPETLRQGLHTLKMNGAETFKNAVRGMTESIRTVLERSGLGLDDISCIIPHQANQRIIDAVASKLQVGKEKIFVNLEKYGNTSAASTAVALSEAYATGRIRRGDRVILTTFGAGLVWATTVMEWSMT